MLSLERELVEPVGASSSLQRLLKINPKGMCQLCRWSLNSLVLRRPLEAESKEKLF